MFPPVRSGNGLDGSGKHDMKRLEHSNSVLQPHGLNAPPNATSMMLPINMNPIPPYLSLTMHNNVLLGQNGAPAASQYVGNAGSVVTNSGNSNVGSSGGNNNNNNNNNNNTMNVSSSGGGGSNSSSSSSTNNNNNNNNNNSTVNSILSSSSVVSSGSKPVLTHNSGKRAGKTSQMDATSNRRQFLQTILEMHGWGIPFLSRSELAHGRPASSCEDSIRQAVTQRGFVLGEIVHKSCDRVVFGCEGLRFIRVSSLTGKDMESSTESFLIPFPVTTIEYKRHLLYRVVHTLNCQTYTLRTVSDYLHEMEAAVVLQSMLNSVNVTLEKETCLDQLPSKGGSADFITGAKMFLTELVQRDAAVRDVVKEDPDGESLLWFSRTCRISAHRLTSCIPEFIRMYRNPKSLKKSPYYQWADDHLYEELLRVLELTDGVALPIGLDVGALMSSYGDGRMIAKKEVTTVVPNNTSNIATTTNRTNSNATTNSMPSTSLPSTSLYHHHHHQQLQLPSPPQQQQPQQPQQGNASTLNNNHTPIAIINNQMNESNNTNNRNPLSSLTITANTTASTTPNTVVSSDAIDDAIDYSHLMPPVDSHKLNIHFMLYNICLQAISSSNTYIPLEELVMQVSSKDCPAAFQHIFEYYTSTLILHNSEHYQIQESNSEKEPQIIHISHLLQLFTHASGLVALGRTDQELTVHIPLQLTIPASLLCNSTYRSLLHTSVDLQLPVAAIITSTIRRYLDSTNRTPSVNNSGNVSTGTGSNGPNSVGSSAGELLQSIQLDVPLKCAAKDVMIMDAESNGRYKKRKVY